MNPIEWIRAKLTTDPVAKNSYQESKRRRAEATTEIRSILDQHRTEEIPSDVSSVLETVPPEAVPRAG